MTDSLLDELARHLAIPAKSGIYITKNELMSLARASEASLRVNERPRMLADVLKSAQSPEELSRILDRVIGLCRLQVSHLTELTTLAPTAAPCFEPWQQRVRKTIERLEAIKEELAPR
ncbi:MAG: hypothetical protein HY791_24365 [Deltaproteobacteria bacterium]|nr:hypothetical protein [Deltaproteobacteria bacterium]